MSTPTALRHWCGFAPPPPARHHGETWNDLASDTLSALIVPRPSTPSSSNSSSCAAFYLATRYQLLVLGLGCVRRVRLTNRYARAEGYRICSCPCSCLPALTTRLGRSHKDVFPIVIFSKTVGLTGRCPVQPEGLRLANCEFPREIVTFCCDIVRPRDVTIISAATAADRCPVIVTHQLFAGIYVREPRQIR
jgi:hypothetical protein